MLKKGSAMAANDVYFYGENVAAFQVILEEVTRAKPGSPETRFITQDAGTSDRLGSKFHHVLFGRRGSGKSSLLRHLEAGKQLDGHLVAWVDQEVFMSLAFPDVLVSTLEQIFRDYASQIAKKDSTPIPKKKFWQRKQLPDDGQQLVLDLREAVAKLEELKSAPDEAEVEWTATTTSQQSQGSGSSAQLSLGDSHAAGRLGHSRDKKRSSGRSDSTVQRYKTKKGDHLEKALPVYRSLIQRVTAKYPDAYVIIDDLYRLPAEDQPKVLGYIHRTVKDTGTWIKVGSIRYWTKLYAGGPPAIGIQAPHDVRTLSLDRGLLDFKSSKRFLESILVALAGEVEVNIERLLSDGARDRLVLASGGVPRDYIGLLSESIALARNRGPSSKTGSERVIAEDVNGAAGRTLEFKMSDLQEDAPMDAADLQRLLIKLTNHCRKTKSACFLVDVLEEELVQQVNRLQNMRFVHAVAEQESVPDPESSRYNVYLLDVS
jgi:hypothetical protein